MKALLIALFVLVAVPVSAQTPIADAVDRIDAETFAQPVALLGVGPEPNVDHLLKWAVAGQIADIATSCYVIHKLDGREINPNQERTCYGIAAIKSIAFTAADLAIRWQDSKHPTAGRIAAWLANLISWGPAGFNLVQIIKAVHR